jgi:chromosome condensin MukBEF complex kleisin-like MukF subunit
MKTIRTPFQIDNTGRVALTNDPATIIEQQITDILVTYRGQRVMLPEHGADLEGFIFAPMRDDVLALKADEVHGILTNGISFGEIVAVRMVPIEGTESSIRLQVYYRLSPTSPVQTIDRTVTGFVTEETLL